MAVAFDGPEDVDVAGVGSGDSLTSKVVGGEGAGTGVGVLAVPAAQGKQGADDGEQGDGSEEERDEGMARLLKSYGVEQRDIDRLTTLAGRAERATWWGPRAQVVPEWLKTFVGLEGLAESGFVFEPIVIPGSLQTED